jgi:hypothetical protein
MVEEKIIQGRCVTSEDVALIDALLGANPAWSRSRLSQELCVRWGWRNGMGQLKDMACRTFLLKLERMGTIHLLETFVERDRFRGTCYRAAGWIPVGTTTGRSRNDSDFTLSVPVKEVYLQPLRADFRRRLCA